MDIFIILKIISFLLTIGVSLWGWYKLPNKKIKIFFLLTLGCFFLSTVLFFPEGNINDWLKHIPFYVGQFLFYLFIKGVINFYLNQEKKSSSLVSSSILPQVVIVNVASDQLEFTHWFDFLTEQGLQHIITLPFLFLIISVIRVRYIYIQSKAFIAVLNFFMFAATLLTLIHVGEFVVESQQWLPFLENSIEYVEFILFYLALLFLWLAIQKLRMVIFKTSV